MAIHFEHTIELPQPPGKVFATLDDVSQTPKWLARCTGIEVLTPGPVHVGTKLRYSYKDGGRSGTMDGQIVERMPGQKLVYDYEDKMMRAGIQFTTEPAGSGTRLTHTIDLTPRSLLTKLASPLIRKQLPKQTITAMESLRALLASRPAAKA